jgi:hypothetical protein
MSYPVDPGQGLIEAINYLLSGPSSLGQNFEGMNALGVTTPGSLGLITTSTIMTYLTGMPQVGPTLDPNPYGGTNLGGTPGAVYRDNADSSLGPPVPAGRTVGWGYPLWNTLPAGTNSPAYPAGIPVVSITPNAATGNYITARVNPDLGRPGITWTNLTNQPFVQGQQIVISGATPSTYNGTYTVLQMLNTGAPIQVVLYSETVKTWGTYTSGASISIDMAARNYGGFFTGNQAIVTVTGPTDRVFVSSTIKNIQVFTYTSVSSFVGSLPAFISLEINRYRAAGRTTLPDIGPGAIYAGGSAYAGYLWVYDGNLISVPINVPSTDPSVYDIGLTDINDITYSNIIDAPNRIGTYMYAFQLTVNSQPGNVLENIILGARTDGFRSFTAQVIKR